MTAKEIERARESLRCGKIPKPTHEQAEWIRAANAPYREQLLKPQPRKVGP